MSIMTYDQIICQSHPKTGFNNAALLQIYFINFFPFTPRKDFKSLKR